MNRTEIERILRLQKGAYEFLLWIDERAERDQSLLNDENLEKWRHGASCEEWVRHIHGSIPVAIRPETDEIPAFSRLFSSFFQTSFRISEGAPRREYRWNEQLYITGGKRKLVAGAPGGKKSAKGKAKLGESARELRLIALEELALDNEILLERAALEQLESDENSREDLTLWTYFHELQRRANFASQGEAVRSLWLAMDKTEREKLNADKILAARERLLAVLKT